MTKGGGFLTPKAISNRIKAKGLQKLRWYCQMCQKQCRDENGMRCHMASEGHLRMMKVFAENPGRIMSEFSEAFLNGFLKTLSHLHGTKRVSANRVYQEYIADKDHIHMNSTAWSSLAGLCKHLGKEGKCVVDETEKGWFIQWIDRDPKTLERQAQMETRQQSELDDEERTRKLIDSQISAGRSLVDGDNEEQAVTFHDLERSSNSQKIGISLQMASKKSAIVSSNVLSSLFTDANEEVSAASSHIHRPGLAGSAMERLMREEEARRQKDIAAMDSRERSDKWLCTGLVVKIMSKTVGGGAYYKKKGDVLSVVDGYVAEVAVEGMAAVKLDQSDLETVLPKVGGKVLIVNGRARGCVSTLLRIDEESFSCSVRVEQGALASRELDGVEYEDVCKLSETIS